MFLSAVSGQTNGLCTKLYISQFMPTPYVCETDSYESILSLAKIVFTSFYIKNNINLGVKLCYRQGRAYPGHPVDQGKTGAFQPERRHLVAKI